MREFSDVERELQLIKLTDSKNGTLYCAPVAAGAPRIVVRHFNGEVAPPLVPAYVDLLAVASAWIAADPELASLVRVEQPTDVGNAFIGRRHLMGTSLDAFLETDPDEDPAAPPPQLARMQTRFRDRAAAASGPREVLLVAVLARSILKRSLKTFYDYGAEQFVIADIKPSRDELEQWAGVGSGR